MCLTHGQRTPGAECTHKIRLPGREAAGGPAALAPRLPHEHQPPVGVKTGRLEPDEVILVLAYNFQWAWSTGWVAGKEAARALTSRPNP